MCSTSRGRAAARMLKSTKLFRSFYTRRCDRSVPAIADRLPLAGCRQYLDESADRRTFPLASNQHGTDLVDSSRQVAVVDNRQPRRANAVQLNLAAAPELR